MPRKKHSGVTEQRKAGLHRLEDAKVLLAGKRWRGAMYLAGYAVECALKYKLMRQWRCYTLEALEERLQARDTERGFFSHSLDLLLNLTGGRERLRNNPPLWTEFAELVDRWKPAWRYDSDPGEAEEATDFVGTVTGLLAWNNL